jgi:predicted aspartyl protease
LVDTGASVTILSEKAFNSIDSSKQPSIKLVNTQLITATGKAYPFIGQSEVKIHIDEHKFVHNVLIADISSHAILGMDILSNVMYF